MSVGYSTTVQILVNDTTTGIYSHAGATPGFDTTAGNIDFVNFLDTAGANPNERSTPIYFSSPITIASSRPLRAG